MHSKKKTVDIKYIEDSIAEVEKPFIQKLKELNDRLDQLTHESESVNLQNAEGLNLVNKASYELGLYKSLNEKGTVKVKVMDLEILNLYSTKLLLEINPIYCLRVLVE